MNSTKLTNIIITGALAIFVVLGMINLQFNYESILNQNNILENQKNAAERHDISERADNKLIIDNVIGKDNIKKLFNKLDIIINQTK